MILDLCSFARLAPACRAFRNTPALCLKQASQGWSNFIDYRSRPINITASRACDSARASAGARTETIVVGQPPMWCSGPDDLMGGGIREFAGPVLSLPYAHRVVGSVLWATKSLRQ